MRARHGAGGRRWRWLATASIAAAMLCVLHAIALAHAMLLSSDPPQGGTVTTPPTRVRLVFSEALEPSLSAIGIVDASGHTTKLVVSSDPHNGHALVAPVDALADGAYRVVWRTVSADGHAVDGSYIFRVQRPADTVTSVVLPPDRPADVVLAWGPSVAGAPLVLAILRGAALGALMGAAGLLYFVGWSRALPSAPRRALRVTRVLSSAAVLLLIAHLVAWLVNGAPGHDLDLDWSRRALGTGQGVTELLRIGLALIALWALALAARPRIAAAFAFAALVVSGALGHPAAMLPVASVPAKALHLVASALWLGGLLWLVTMPADDAALFGREAERVSGLALAAVVVVTLSGGVQSLIFLPSLGALLSTSYGLIVLAKIAGMGVLVAFGAHHRFRGLPALSAELAAAGVEITSGGGVRLTALRRTVWREVGVMAIVIALGGLLAYVSPNVPEHPVPMAMPLSR